MIEKVLIVGGSFDDNGGRPSSLVNKIADQFITHGLDITVHNGGYFDEVESILNSCTEYAYVLWWANIPNDKPKIRNVKDVNPKTILITSKRNDNNKYRFSELINRALKVKANLCVQFSKEECIFVMTLFDPLGNVWYTGTDIDAFCSILINRMKYLKAITRQGTIQVDQPKPEIPDEPEFFKLIKEYAKVFHELVNPDNSVTRFLGNTSYRCQRGFPSFRNGLYIYVSQRDVDKRYIDKNSFVPVKMIDGKLYYWGDHKPSVDTPIQVRLYEKLPNINYMLHAHVYIKDAPFTVNMVPCGGLEEVDEIMSVIGDNPDLDFYQINLIGHGSIVMANNADQLKNINYIARTLPEIH